METHQDMTIHLIGLKREATEKKPMTIGDSRGTADVYSSCRGSLLSGPLHKYGLQKQITRSLIYLGGKTSFGQTLLALICIGDFGQQTCNFFKICIQNAMHCGKLTSGLST